GDRCVLPPGARLLARNEVGVQAFTSGRDLAVQFHPELDAAQLERWFDSGGRVTAVLKGKDPDALLAQTAHEEPEARRRAATLVDTYLTHVARH
ncbi:MAG: aminotransferase, partial [Acidimicrobiales bacterium]